MDQEKKLKINEERLQETISKSKAALFSAERERILSYHEFLWMQLKVIRKRWWLLQILALAVLWAALTSMQDELYIRRSMGIVSCLFVIFIIPELWKNRSCGSMEIEVSSYYSLKQVYAARMLLFGIADTLLITVFFVTAAVRFPIGISEMVIQFLFPLCVTACICFGILCSRRSLNETMSVILCMVWSAVWLLIVVNERIYNIITVPVWIALLGVAILFLAVTVFRILKSCDKYLEVSFDEIRA